MQGFTEKIMKFETFVRRNFGRPTSLEAALVIFREFLTRAELFLLRAQSDQRILWTFLTEDVRSW
jgi:hypothetical protein